MRKLYAKRSLVAAIFASASGTAYAEEPTYPAIMACLMEGNTLAKESVCPIQLIGAKLCYARAAKHIEGYTEACTYAFAYAWPSDKPSFLAISYIVFNCEQQGQYSELSSIFFHDGQATDTTEQKVHVYERPSAIDTVIKAICDSLAR